MPPVGWIKQAGRVVEDRGVLNDQLSRGRAAGARRERYAGRGEALHHAIFDVQPRTAGEHDAGGAGRIDAVEDQSAQMDHVAGAGADDDAAGAGGGDHAGAADGVTEDGDRLGDGHRAEVAGIEHIDLAAGTGLRQRRGEGQAGRHARARIGIAAQRRRDEGLRSTAPPPDAENIAVTLSIEFMVTRQLPLPVQAPPQPLKVAPPVGVAVSVTGVPLE